MKILASSLFCIPYGHAISQAKKHQKSKSKKDILDLEIPQKYDSDKRCDTISKQRHQTIHGDDINIPFADLFEEVCVRHHLHQRCSRPSDKKQDCPDPKTFPADKRYKRTRHCHHDKADREHFFFAVFSVRKLPAGIWIKTNGTSMIVNMAPIVTQLKPIYLLR